MAKINRFIASYADRFSGCFRKRLYMVRDGAVRSCKRTMAKKIHQVKKWNPFA